MSSSPLAHEKFRRPNISFTEMLKKGAAGVYRERDEYSPFMYRALVIAIDTEGGKLETIDGKPIGDPLHTEVRSPAGQLLAAYDVFLTRGPNNPKNSVRARIVSNNMDQVIDDDNLRTFWPLFPGTENPSAGELVYVVFEDEQFSHGLWLARVPFAAPSPTDPPTTKNLVLMSEQLRTAQRENKALFPGPVAPPPVVGGSPVRQPQRLTSLFVNTGK